MKPEPTEREKASSGRRIIVPDMLKAKFLNKDGESTSSDTGIFHGFIIAHGSLV